MKLEQRRQAMLQLHLSDRKFYCLLGATYIVDLAVYPKNLLKILKWRYSEWDKCNDYLLPYTTPLMNDTDRYSSIQRRIKVWLKCPIT